jgi:hypothetical protein
VPQFADVVKYDSGWQTSIAAHPSGLTLEVHQTHSLLDWSIWYRIGTQEGTGVKWGASQHSGATGFWPTVAISGDGYVVLVNSNQSTKGGSHLYYRVGKIDPYAGHNQSITWLTDAIHWDAGFHSSIAMNDNGVIVGVHESGTGGNGIYYRVGHLRNRAGEDYTIAWDSAPWGIHYDDGINPHIAINNVNHVVAVHPVPGETLLHYRRGTLSGGAIDFGESKRYDNHAEQPAVALLDSGVVLEAHSLGGLISRTGKLSLSNPEEIEWFDPVKVVDYTDFEYPALATNGTHAVVTFEAGEVVLGITREVYCSVARLCEVSQVSESVSEQIPTQANAGLSTGR